MPRMLTGASGMDHLWRVAEEHLALIDDPAVEHAVKLFAIEVVVCALDHAPPERTLARTFAVLQRLVDRDDPVLGDLLPFLPDAETESMRASFRRLAARTVERRDRETMTTVLWALLTRRMPVPGAWMVALLDVTPDDELIADFAYLLFDWAASPGADAKTRDAMLAARPGLRVAHASVCSEAAALNFDEGMTFFSGRWMRQGDE